MKRLFLFLSIAAGCLGGTPVESEFEDTLFEDGLSQPTSLAWAPDGSNRLFVCLKASGVAVVENGVRRRGLFASFPQLYTQSECGVLGIAFDPDYATNRHVYVFVTVSASEQRIVRFTDQQSVGTQRANIITGLPTLGANHDGGALGFGPDGKLYWAVGDLGAKRGVDANLTSLAAKVGRANKDGSVPTDNPFFDGAGPNNDYIWATGFRNPFSLAFRPGSGELWLNVVGSTPDGQTDPRSTAGYEQVFVVQPGDDGGYDNFEGNQPTTPRYTTPFPRPCIRPVIQYKTGYQAGGAHVRGISRIGPDGPGPLFVNTTTAHPYRVGQAVRITGAGPYDGLHVVQSVTGSSNSTQFQIARPAGPTEPILNNIGSIDPLPQGNCITGGCFYDSSAFPPPYQGNFFYGDYVLGAIMRAQLGSNGRPVRITRFITGLGGPTDIAVGPDGALYYCDNARSHVRRVAFTGTPGFIVSSSSISMIEGGKATFTVRLGTPPPEPLTVQVHKTGTPSDIEILGETTLTFTASDWDRPRPITLFAPADADLENDTASFAVTAPGYDSQSVTATATDSNLPPLVLSTGTVDLTEGRTAIFTVALPEQPAKAVMVRVRGAGGPPKRASVYRNVLMRFTPKNWSTPQRVVLRGLQDTNRDDEIVTYVVRAPGYLEREVVVSVHDNDPARPVFTSFPGTTAVVHLPYSFTAQARALPAATFELLQAPEGMTIDSASGVVSWIPSTPGNFPVTIRAFNSRGSTEQSFTIAVAADSAPIAYITSPQEGDFVTGSNAEFFGGSLDDYGTYEARFYIDGQLVFTDSNREGHYHLNAAHNLFDTTLLSNGMHTLKMVVTDDAGQTGEASVNVTVAN